MTEEGWAQLPALPWPDVCSGSGDVHTRGAVVPTWCHQKSDDMETRFTAILPSLNRDCLGDCASVEVRRIDPWCARARLVPGQSTGWFEGVTSKLITSVPSFGLSIFS